MYWATGLTGWQRAAMGPAAYPYAAPAPFVQPSADQELAVLQGQLKAMQQGIDQIQDRIQELEKDQDQDQEKK